METLKTPILLSQADLTEVSAIFQIYRNLMYKFSFITQFSIQYSMTMADHLCIFLAYYDS